MPDSSLERTIKLLIKTGILPIKKIKKEEVKKENMQNIMQMKIVNQIQYQ